MGGKKADKNAANGESDKVSGVVQIISLHIPGYALSLHPMYICMYACFFTGNGSAHDVDVKVEVNDAKQAEPGKEDEVDFEKIDLDDAFKYLQVSLMHGRACSSADFYGLGTRDPHPRCRAHVHLQSSHHGLSNQEVEQRLQKYGHNKLPDKTRHPILSFLL